MKKVLKFYFECVSMNQQHVLMTKKTSGILECIKTVWPADWGR